MCGQRIWADDVMPRAAALTPGASAGEFSQQSNATSAIQNMQNKALGSLADNALVAWQHIEIATECTEDYNSDNVNK